MTSPEFGIQVAPNVGEREQDDSACLMVRIAKVNDVFNGMLAPRPGAVDKAVEDIEATMVTKEADDNGAYRLVCPVGGCAVACNITIQELRFDEWSGQACPQDVAKPQNP